MKKLDERKISLEVMEQIRVCAIKRVQQGESLEKVIASRAFSVHTSIISLPDTVQVVRRRLNLVSISAGRKNSAVSELLGFI